jgi:hypothetical protein
MRVIAQKISLAGDTIGQRSKSPDPVVAESGFKTRRKFGMTTQMNKFPRLPLLLAGIAAILVSGIALASLAISGQGFSGRIAPAVPAVAAPAAAAPGARNYRCAECGVIESTRAVEESTDRHGANAAGRMAVCNKGGIGRHAVRKHEITVRLRDGSMRVITDAKSARWSHGEAVTIIAGLN